MKARGPTSGHGPQGRWTPHLRRAPPRPRPRPRPQRVCGARARRAEPEETRGEGRQPLGAGSAGRAARVSGPLRATPEEVPGPSGSVSPSWSCGAATVRGAVGGPRARCRPRCPRPGPMALVTVSRSPPVSGHSTPVGPTVSLALLWSCPRSWLLAGPGEVGPAQGQATFKPGGVCRGTPSLRLEGIEGALEAPRNSDQVRSRALSASPACGRPYPLPSQPELGLPRHLQHPSHPYPCCPTWTWAWAPPGSPDGEWTRGGRGSDTFSGSTPHWRAIPTLPHFPSPESGEGRGVLTPSLCPGGCFLSRTRRPRGEAGSSEGERLPQHRHPHPAARPGPCHPGGLTKATY